MPGFDPAADLRINKADSLLVETANQLMELLRFSVGELSQFPPFPGALFTFGIEVDLDGFNDSELGCIVITEDGDLKELQIGVDADSFNTFGDSDPVTSRSERLLELNVASWQRVILAHSALLQVQRLLWDQNHDITGQVGQI